MDRPQSEKLNAPSDFVTTPAQIGVAHETTPSLMTPSQFITAPKPTTRAVYEPPLVSVVPESLSSRGRGAGLGCIPTVPSTTSDPWLAVAQFQQEILELRRENHRILLQYRDNRAVRQSDDKWGTDVEHWRYETQRLRGQLDSLKENADKQREEIRDRESKINRLSVDREELGVELSRCRAELTQSQNEQETLRKKLADLQRQRVTERESWQTELHSSRQEAECLKGEVQEQSLRLGEHMRRERELQQHLDDMTSKHQTQLQHLNESHSTEVASLNQTIGDLQNRLSKSTLEVSSLKGCLEDTSSERDELRDQLSQLKNNLASQSETLQNLRNYIATLAAERGAEDQLSDKVKRLEKEKEALQLSVELLNVRVKSVNDILAIQEKELGEQYDTVLKGGSKSTRLLRLWREKVFALLVQLRSRDTQLRAEQRQLHNMVYALEEEVEGLRSQNSVLKNSLQDRTAQLELQVLQTQAVQQELSSAIEQKDKLKQKNQTLETSLSTITETIHRLSAVCEERAGLMNSALSHLSGLGQRLIFATKRLDTVHGLLVRREALRKVQQATKPPGHDPSESCINDLKAQVALLSEERDKLAQELKKTPELIHNALSDLQQQRDREVGRLTEALAQSREELEKCEAGRVQAHTQCEQLEGTITELRTEALHLQQHSARVLQERLSEVEKTCTKQLRDLESQLNTARREHTKTVVALRQVQRQAEREREQLRETQRLQSEHTQTEIKQLHTQLRDKNRDCNILLAVVQERGFMDEYKRMRKAAIYTSKALLENQQTHKPKPKHRLSQHSPGGDGLQVEQMDRGVSEQPSLCKDSLLNVLGELQSLSAAVIDSSDSTEEDEGAQGDSLLFHRKGKTGVTLTHTQTHENN